MPDICLVAGSRSEEKVFTKPPLVVIEILSPEDRLSRMQQRIDEYLKFGVRYVWLIDPEARRAWAHTTESIREAKDLILRTEDPAIELPLADIFREIDQF